MQPLSQIIKRKQTRKNIGAKDIGSIEKHIRSAFLEAVAATQKNIASSDISSVDFKEGALYIRTSHPGTAGELWRCRENIRKYINTLLGYKKIKSIKIK